MRFIRSFFFIAALQKVDVNFSLYTSGSCTTLVKDFTEEWDNTAKAKMYDAMVFEQDESNLSDAVLFATHHITEGAGPKVGKTIFVFSDGYPSAPLRLKKSLSFAENTGVQTIAVGIGYFTEGISKYFPNFVLSDSPAAFPKALQSFYLGEPKLESLSEAVGSVVAEKVIYDNKRLENMDEGWRIEIDNVYQQEVDRTRKELRISTYNAYTTSNKLKINLCFVLDTTGSMGSYIQMAKDKIKSIIDNIKSHINDHFGRATNLQVAFVGYKISGNGGHLDKIPFTDDTVKLQNFVNSQTASGGSTTDGREDKEDGMIKALSFDWDGSVKFMVLISDITDRGKIGTINQTIQRIAGKNIYFLHVTINSSTNSERDGFKAAYKTSLDSKIKDTGFMDIDMKNISNDTNILSEKIVEKVSTVIVAEFM